MNLQLPTRTILFLSANPKDTSRLRLAKEVHDIEKGLDLSADRDNFELISKGALQEEDLRRALLKYKPQIVHFSGHGTGDLGLILENEMGDAQPVATETVVTLFKHCPSVECVVLNACYSEVQARAIATHVPYVIGMNQAISDTVAIKFAVGFYDALGYGHSYEAAYEIGATAIGLEPSIVQRDIDHKADDLSVERRDPSRPILIWSRNLESPIGPSPVSLENPEGPVPLESRFYIERPPAESDCYSAITSPGALIRVYGPQQMGKTSLMQQILNHATQQGYRTACLSFREVDKDCLADLDQFLQWFCINVADELNLPDELDVYWQSRLGSKRKCRKYFQKYLLPELAKPLVLALDDVDRIFDYPHVGIDFLGMLRNWYDSGKNQVIWQRFRLVMAHTKDVTQFLSLDHHQSPFNVGEERQLRELTQSQLEDLIQRHGLNWSQTVVDKFITLVGGHPYLARVALYYIARGQVSLSDLLAQSPMTTGIYNELLHRQWLSVEKDTDLMATLQHIMAADGSLKIGANQTFADNALKLQNMGLVKLQGKLVSPMCDLYRRYFQDRWGVGQ